MAKYREYNSAINGLVRFRLTPEEEAEIDKRWDPLPWTPEARTWTPDQKPEPVSKPRSRGRGIIIGYEKKGDPIRKLRKDLKWYEPRQSPRGLNGRVITKVKPVSREFAALTVGVQLTIVRLPRIGGHLC